MKNEHINNNLLKKKVVTINYHVYLIYQFFILILKKTK